MMECVYRCRANGRVGVDPESKGDTGLTREPVVLLGEARFFSSRTVSVNNSFCDCFVEC